jgi:hypothetical protein
MRRKGEKPIERTWPDWDCGWHPVRRSIADRTGWFHAWIAQATTPWLVVARKSGVSIDRIAEIDRGATATADEIEAFAKVWNVDPGQVVTSIAQSRLAKPS